MKTNDELLIDYLRVESDKIKATNKSFNEMIIANHEKRNKDSNLIAKLKAEIRELKADIIHDANVSYDLDDKHVEIIKRLETEKDALLVANGELLQSNIKLRSA